MNLTPEILKVLQTAPLFQGVPGRLLVEKLNESRLRTLNSGEPLLVPGQANNVIYVILSGRLRIHVKDPDSDPIGMLGEGECVGETSIIGDALATAYIIAATDCRLLAIDNAAIWEMIDASHQAAHNVLSVLNMRIRPEAQIAVESREDDQGFSENAMVDELTGLYNRQWMEGKIGRYLRRCAFDSQPGCLITVAIDGFGELIDKYGQLGSEQVLRDTSHTMMACLRPGDQAGHFERERFAVFMPYTALADGCTGAERLRAAINESVIVLPTGDALPPISVSLGITPIFPDDIPASLIVRANEALQQAIGDGGNCLKWINSKEAKLETKPAPANGDAAQPIKPFMSLWPGTHP